LDRQLRASRVAEEVPELWRQIAEKDKALVAWPVWSDPLLPPPNRRGQNNNPDKLHTTAAETVQTLVALAGKSGPGLEGVRLRIVAMAYRRELDVTALLEVPGARSFINIARVDCWPSGPHANTRTRRHSALRHLPPIISGHHIHRFADNARLGMEAFLPPNNLPVAGPIENAILSFRDFTRIVGQEFKIDGLDDIDPPQSWKMLL
jgi:hypothetical protein